jgi:tetratricopeptide (TPR) repeat protein
VTDLLRQSIEDYPGVSAFRPFLAAVLCELGREDEARTLLDEFAASGLDDIPHEQVWLTAFVGAADAAAHLGDRDLAARLYEHLSPWSGQVVWNNAVTLGGVPYYLGLLAATLRDHDAAEEHFRQAVELHERIGARAWLARSLLGWGSMLLERSGSGDAERARAMLERAGGLARQGGYAAIDRRARELLEGAASVGS